MKKKFWVSGAGICVLAAGFLFTAPLRAAAGTIPDGFTVAGFELTGMTGDEAAQTIAAYVDEAAAQEITLTVGGGEVKTTARELGYGWVNEEEIRQAADQYAGGNLLRRYLNLQSLRKEPVAMELQTEVDGAKVAEFVKKRCGEFNREARDAEITRENGVFRVTESQPGQEIDAEATAAALNEAVKGGLREPVTVAAVVEETEPERTAEALSAIEDELGSFSTSFSTGNVSRSKNLRNGASKVDGCVLMPGEEFSAYEVLTPFTLENGYAAAGSYANGQVVDTVGGGACQLCTTLYNAALFSELEITQRQNHSMIVGYVKPSQDSAIAGTVKDLKFKNPYDTPVYLEGNVNGGTITFTIYGKETRPANREIKFVSETLGSKDPGEPILKVDPALAPGARVREQSAHTGLQSRLWKYVYVDGVETEKEILHTDSYMASKAIYRVGPELPAAVPDPAPVIPEESLPANPQQPSGPAGPAADGPAGEIGGTSPNTGAPADGGAAGNGGSPAGSEGAGNSGAAENPAAPNAGA